MATTTRRHRVSEAAMRRTLREYHAAYERQHDASERRAPDYYEALQSFYDAEHRLRTLAERVALEE